MEPLRSRANLWSCPHCARIPGLHTERDIIGLTESSRLVYFAAQADLEDCLTVSRAMLKRFSSTTNMYSGTSLLWTVLGSKKCVLFSEAAQFRILHLREVQLYSLTRPTVHACCNTLHTHPPTHMPRHPRIRIYSQLMDAHLYLLRRWVLDYLTENK